MSNELPASSTGSVSPRFDVAPYRPDGGYAPSGVAMLICALIIVGAVLGFIAHWISQYIYLIAIFPLVIGFLMGAVGMRMIRQGRVRNPWMGGAAGFLGGALAMFMMHYFDYRDFKAQLDKELTPQIKAVAKAAAAHPRGDVRPNPDGTEKEQLEFLIRAASVEGLLDFMDLQAAQGVELKKTGRGSGINLGYYGSYIYWMLEVLLVAGVTFAMARGAAAEPYCRRCDQWKRSRVLGSFSADPNVALAAINSGDLHAMGAVQTSPSGGPLRISAACCDGCVGQGAVDVKLEHLTQDKKGNTATKMLAHVTYPPEALPHLLALFPQPPQQQENAPTPPA